MSRGPSGLWEQMLPAPRGVGGKWAELRDPGETKTWAEGRQMSARLAWPMAMWNWERVGQRGVWGVGEAEFESFVTSRWKCQGGFTDQSREMHWVLLVICGWGSWPLGHWIRQWEERQWGSRPQQLTMCLCRAEVESRCPRGVFFFSTQPQILSLPRFF